MIKKFFRKYVYKSLTRIEKRLRYVISTLILSLVMLFSLSAFNFLDNFWLLVPLIILSAYVMTYFSVLEGIEKTEWLTLFIMPVLVSCAFYFFFFLFPARWITRLPFIITYAISIYAMLSVANIFNVGVEKSLQLYRAAFSVNYFYQTVVMFLMVNVLLSLRMHFMVNAVVTFMLVFLLSLQLLWSVKPKISLDRKLISYSLFIAFCVSQVMIIASFVPLKSSIVSLLITASYYCLSGLLYHYIDQRLFKQTIREYLFVIGFIVCIVLLSISW